jgi:hypothetical protein
MRNWISKKCFPDHPSAASMEEWSEIHKKDKESHPLLYWIDQTLMTYLSVKKMQLNDIKYWFMYRFSNAHKYHLVRTGLQPDYYENDKRILHANFNILKEYIEIEQANKQYHWGNESKSTTGKEAGVKRLDWETELRFTDDELPAGDPRIGNLTPQAISAREIRKLYFWWIDERPARQDPHDVFPCTYEKESDSTDEWMGIWGARTDEEKKADRVRFESIRKLEDKYEAEDTNMLIRLMRIRKNMWS